MSRMTRLSATYEPEGVVTMMHHGVMLDHDGLCWVSVYDDDAVWHVSAPFPSTSETGLQQVVIVAYVVIKIK